MTENKMKVQEGRPRKYKKHVEAIEDIPVSMTAEEVAKYKKDVDIRRAKTAELRIKIRRALGIHPRADISKSMKHRDKLRALGFSEFEIELKFPLPSSVTQQIEPYTPEDIKVTFKDRDPFDPKVIPNKFSTDTSLYSMTKIIETLIDSVLYSFNQLSNREVGTITSPYFKEKIPVMPTKQMAEKSLEYRKKNPSVFKKNPNLTAEVGEMRTLAEEFHHLFSVYNKDICAIKTRAFKEGCFTYFEDAQIYEATINSLQNIVNKLREYGKQIDTNPIAELENIIHTLIDVCETTFEEVHFSKAIPVNFYDSRINTIINSKNKIIEVISFIKDNMAVLQRPDLHIFNSKHPEHEYRLWEL